MLCHKDSIAEPKLLHDKVDIQSGSLLPQALWNPDLTEILIWLKSLTTTAAASNPMIWDKIPQMVLSANKATPSFLYIPPALSRKKPFQVFEFNRQALLNFKIKRCSDSHL